MSRKLPYLFAAFVALWIGVWAPGFPTPELWEPLAQAVGVRPPETICPALWQILVSPWVTHLSSEQVFWGLRLLGALSLAGLYLLVHTSIYRLLPVLVRRRAQESRERARVPRFAVALAALAFVASPSLWRSGLLFSPLMLNYLLLFGSFAAILRFFSVYRMGPLVVSGLLAGLLAADSPLGYFLLVGSLLTMFTAYLRGSGDPDVNPLSEQGSLILAQRWYTTAFIFAWVCALAANGGWFVYREGLAALKLEGMDLVIHFLRHQLSSLIALASVFGWGAFVLVAVAPLVLVVVLSRKAMNEEAYLTLWSTLGYSFVGLFAFFELTDYSVLWFWTKGVRISPELVGVASFLLALALAYALVVLAIDVFVRDYAWLSGKRLDVMKGPSAEAVEASGRLGWVRIVAIATPILLVVSSLALKSVSAEHRVTRLLARGVAAMVADAAGVPIVTTDGHFDAILEFCARDQGGLKALSFIPGHFESLAREQYLRTRGETDEDDLAILREQGAPQAVRTWVKTLSPRAGALALQLGTEFWAHEVTREFAVLGTCVRTDAAATNLVGESVARARALADDLIALHAAHVDNRIQDEWLLQKKDALAWRLSRLARVRSVAADARGDVAASRQEAELAEALDAGNVALERLGLSSEWMPQQMGGGLTPREGLRFALSRGDFLRARPFARKILVQDASDATANYAMGMACVMEKKWTQAADYLESVLKERGEEPVVLNNLAMVEMKLGRLESALKHAEKAHELMPDQVEIANTLADIRRLLAREASKK